MTWPSACIYLPVWQSSQQPCQICWPKNAFLYDDGKCLSVSQIRISWILSNFLTYTWGSWGPEREWSLLKITQLMRGSQDYKQDFQTQVQGHIPPGQVLIDGTCGTGKWPSALKQVLLLGNAQGNGVGNTQMCTLAFIWVRDVYLPVILSAVLQLPCPSALQTHPEACPAHWIIQRLLAMLPWGAQMLMPLVKSLQGSPGKGGNFRHRWKQKRKLTPWRSYMIYPHIYDACLSFFLLARWSWSLHISSQ